MFKSSRQELNISNIKLTLPNTCIYNRAIFRTLAYQEPEASSKSCETCKMITNIQSPGIVRTVYSNIFKEILGYSGIMQVPSLFHTLNQRRKEKPPLLFLKIKRKCPDFGKKGSDYEAPLLKIPSSPLLFAKPSILNVSQCSEYVCVSITAQQFVQ